MNTCDYCGQQRNILFRHPTVTGNYCAVCKDKLSLPPTTPNRVIR